MRPVWLRWLTVGVLTLVGAECLTAQSLAQTPGAKSDPALITGHVFEGGSLAGLSGVDVRLLGAETGVTTNDAGDFRLVVSVQGSVTVVLRKLGYDAVGV